MGPSAGANQDYFLKIDTIDGESGDAKHKGEIDVLSWSIGESNGGSMAFQGGGGSGKVAFQDFHFTQRMSKASPKLFLACASGQHIPKAVLTVRKAGGTQQEFFQVTMSDLLVSSYQTGGAGSDNSLPIEQISINFAKIEVQYKEQDAKGNLGGPIKAGWDLKQNQKV